MGLYFAAVLVITVTAALGIKSGMFKKFGKAVYRLIRSEKGETV